MPILNRLKVLLYCDPKMTTFNFTLPEDQAELLLDIIREHAEESRQDALSHYEPGFEQERDWLNEHADTVDCIWQTQSQRARKELDKSEG